MSANWTVYPIFPDLATYLCIILTNSKQGLRVRLVLSCYFSSHKILVNRKKGCRGSLSPKLLKDVIKYTISCYLPYKNRRTSSGFYTQLSSLFLFLCVALYTGGRCFCLFVLFLYGLVATDAIFVKCQLQVLLLKLF